MLHPDPENYWRNKYYHLHLISSPSWLKQNTPIVHANTKWGGEPSTLKPLTCLKMLCSLLMVFHYQMMICQGPCQGPLPTVLTLSNLDNQAAHIQKLSFHNTKVPLCSNPPTSVSITRHPTGCQEPSGSRGRGVFSQQHLHKPPSTCFSKKKILIQHSCSPLLFLIFVLLISESCFHTWSLKSSKTEPLSTRIPWNQMCMLWRLYQETEAGPMPLLLCALCPWVASTVVCILNAKLNQYPKKQKT